MTGEFEPVNLEEVVDLVKADLAELVRSEGPRSGRRASAEVWGDRDRIGQLLANLIGNGLKYNQSQDPGSRWAP